MSGTTFALLYVVTVLLGAGVALTIAASRSQRKVIWAAWGGLVALLAGLGLAVLVEPEISPSLAANVFAAFCLLAGVFTLGFSVGIWLRNGPLGTVLVALESSQDRRAMRWMVLVIGLQGVAATRRLPEGGFDLLSVSWAFLVSSFIVLTICAALQAPLVREGGFADAMGPVRWDRIRRFEWGGRNGRTLTVWAAGVPLLTPNKIRVTVAEKDAAMVDRLLRERATSASRVLPQPPLQEPRSL